VEAFRESGGHESESKRAARARPVTASAGRAHDGEEAVEPDAKSKKLMLGRISRCASISCGGGWAPGGTRVDGEGLADGRIGEVSVLLRGVGSAGDGGGRDMLLYTRTVSAPKRLEILVPAAPVPGPLPATLDERAVGASSDSGDRMAIDARCILDQLKPSSLVRRAPPASLHLPMTKCAFVRVFSSVSICGCVCLCLCLCRARSHLVHDVCNHAHVRRTS
jgi:hypothetical protein